MNVIGSVGPYCAAQDRNAGREYDWSHEGFPPPLPQQAIASAATNPLDTAKRGGWPSSI